jgi:hypothetical protein
MVIDPKPQDLYIFDPSVKDMLVLERIVGIHVLTTSDVDRRTDEPVKHLRNSAGEPKKERHAPAYAQSHKR